MAEARTIIRDTEIEETFQQWFDPIYKAADIPSESVKVVIVQDSQVNAFVAGGANIFFYTGLIEKTDRPEELIGVFAHELGHIQGGHLISQRAAGARASYETILGTILGIGAAVLTGDGRAAAAIGSAASGVAVTRFLSHSRVNESAADQAAATYFENAEMNPEGLVTFFEKLEADEFLPASQQSEYFRTHPLTANRIDAMRAIAERSPHRGESLPAKFYDQHARIKAKLIGFTDPGRVAWIYDDRDASIPAIYARAIAAYRENRIERALSEINTLITREPQNPYFHELKGQMLVDFSRLDEGITSYQKALNIKPDAALIRIALGHAILSNAKNDADINTAIDHFERAKADEKQSTRLNRLLGTAYGRLGKEDVAKVYLAEEALLQRNLPLAKRHATSALKTLPADSRDAIKAQDILSFVENAEEKG